MSLLPLSGFFRIAAAALLLSASSGAETVSLCDSRNPPYVLGTEDGSAATGGLAVQVAEAVFARLPGVDLEITILPWARCLDLARSGDYDGVLKLLYREERAEYLEFTKNPIYRMEMAMFYRPEQFPDGLSWTSITDLAPYKLGVVQGSSNGSLVDAAIADGTLRIDAVAGEALNVRKLAAGRIDMFPNDRVMGRANVREQGLSDEITSSEQVLESAEIVIGISKLSAAVELLPEIDRVLGELWEEGEVDRILMGTASP